MLNFFKSQISAELDLNSIENFDSRLKKVRKNAPNATTPPKKCHEVGHLDYGTCLKCIIEC